MPRRVLKVQVTNPEELPENQDATMGGFPEDGGEFDENQEPLEEIDDEPVQKAAPTDYAAQMTALQAQLAATQAELGQLRSSIPPPQRVAEPEVVETNWDDEFYNSPTAAMKKFEAGLLKKAEASLTAKYQQDIGQRTFWSRFYGAHPDLEDADDLVRSTLSANMNHLGGLSIPKAIENLAGLTRARISGYVDKSLKARSKKATVEGAGSTIAQRQPVQTSQPYSLSATIKSRRAKRASAA